jgi:hypothetical protein
VQRIAHHQIFPVAHEQAVTFRFCWHCPKVAGNQSLGKRFRLRGWLIGIAGHGSHP